MYRIFLMLLSVIIAGEILATAAIGADDRAPVPAAADRHKVSEQVREVYAAEYRAAEKDPDQRAELIAGLRDTANADATSVAEKFALLDEARQQAIAAGSARLATQIIDDMGRFFAIKTLDVTSATLKQIADSTTSPKARLETFAVAFDTLDVAIVQADIAAVQRLLAIADRVTRRPSGKSMRIARKDFLARRKQLQTLLENWRTASLALKTLETVPQDPEANLVLGSFYCFDCKNFGRGLNYLALSGDDALSALARSELRNPRESAQQSKLANQWYDLAQTLDDSHRHVALGRAAYWYTRALPNIEGLTRLKTEKRLADLKAELPDFDKLASADVVIETGRPNKPDAPPETRKTPPNPADSPVGDLQPPTADTPAPDKPLTFTVWKYLKDESGRSGEFRKQAGSDDWVETKDGKTWARFREFSRTSRYVVIHDQSRGIWVRLTLQSAAWSRDRTTWRNFARAGGLE